MPPTILIEDPTQPRHPAAVMELLLVYRRAYWQPALWRERYSARLAEPRQVWLTTAQAERHIRGHAALDVMYRESLRRYGSYTPANEAEEQLGRFVPLQDPPAPLECRI